MRSVHGIDILYIIQYNEKCKRHKQIRQWIYEYKQKILNKKRAVQGRRHGHHGCGNNSGHGGNCDGKLLVK